MVADAGALEGVRERSGVWTTNASPALTCSRARPRASTGREMVPLLAPFAESRIEAFIYQRGVEGRKRLGSAWAG